MTADLLEFFTALKKQGVFQMEAIRVVAISVDNDAEWMIQVRWAGRDESEIAWEPWSNNHQDAPAIKVGQLRKLKLTKSIRMYGFAAKTWHEYLVDVLYYGSTFSGSIISDGRRCSRFFTCFFLADRVLHAIVSIAPGIGRS